MNDELQPVDYIDDNEPWTQDSENGRIYLFAPERSAIRIRPIAHGIANTVRFNRQARDPYSVGQHCCHVSAAVATDPDATAWDALHAHMHDAGEFATGDIPTPNLSRPEYAWVRPLERRWLKRIYFELALPSPIQGVPVGDAFEREGWMPPVVAKWDAIMTAVEALALMPPNDYWNKRADKLRAVLGRDLPVLGEVWSASYAKEQWLARFDVLRPR